MTNYAELLNYKSCFFNGCEGGDHKHKPCGNNRWRHTSGWGGDVFKQPPSHPRPVYKKNLHGSRFVLFTENKNRGMNTSSLPNQCSDVRGRRPMRTNLHSLGPVATRHFSACPTHVATTPGNRRSVSRVAALVAAWATVMRTWCLVTMRYGVGGGLLYFSMKINWN